MSPEVLKDGKPFKNQKGEKLESVRLSIRAATEPLASHLWIKLKKVEQDLLAGCFSELALSSLSIHAFLFSSVFLRYYYFLRLDLNVRNQAAAGIK